MRVRRYSAMSKHVATGLALLACLILLFIPLARNLKKQQEVNRQIASLKEEADRAEAKNSDFKKMLSYLQSDQFVEEQAKLKMGLKKEGEKVVVVTNLDVAATTATSALASPGHFVRLSVNWSAWFNYFFSR